jgi:hypothetical protein
VVNWTSYNESLVRRGEVILDFDIPGHEKTYNVFEKYIKAEGHYQTLSDLYSKNRRYTSDVKRRLNK